MKKIMIILFLFILNCSSDKVSLKQPNANSKARDILEYGRALYNKGEYKSAINQFRYVISKFSENKKECAWAQYELAYTYYVMKDYKIALNEFKKVEMLYPEESGAIILAKKMINEIELKLK
jgi:outer membrane protein assembly factor BamD (BamD/ComL family)